jgi:hypothetical protein
MRQKLKTPLGIFLVDTKNTSIIFRSLDKEVFFVEYQIVHDTVWVNPHNITLQDTLQDLYDDLGEEDGFTPSNIYEGLLGIQGADSFLRELFVVLS